MAYEKTVWANGDVITAEKMNKIEDGVVTGGGTVELYVQSLEPIGTTTWKGKISDSLIREDCIKAINAGKSIIVHAPGGATFCLNGYDNNMITGPTLYVNYDYYTPLITDSYQGTFFSISKSGGAEGVLVVNINSSFIPPDYTETWSLSKTLEEIGLADRDGVWVVCKYGMYTGYLISSPLYSGTAVFRCHAQGEIMDITVTQENSSYQVSIQRYYLYSLSDSYSSGAN